MSKNLELVTNGVSDYVIIYGKEASLSEITAAKELQKYIEKISGAKLPIFIDDETMNEKEIIVGKTNREIVGDFQRDELGDEGFVIRTSNDKLWLVGSEKRGTLYSVYTFLENYLGCRFYTEGCEKVPKMQTISLCEIREDKQIPQFIFRDVAWFSHVGTDISVKRKINFKTWDRVLPEEVGGGIAYAKEEGGHTFSIFINPEKYFEAHPEYFSMNEKGERVSDKQLCLTNPEVYQIVLSEVRRWLAEDPDANIISISQNDTEGPCLCENCMKVYEEEGGAYSGTLIRFVNAIAEDIAEDYPNVWVDTYAYTYTRKPPAKTKPAKNVHIRLCTIRCCFSHPYDSDCEDLSPQTNIYDTKSSFMEDWRDWANICDHIFMYDYSCNFQHFMMTFPNFSNMRRNCELFAKYHVMGVMNEGNSHSASAEFGELRGYLISKLLWEPNMSEERYYEYMEDFLEGVYGPGGKYIREYIALAEELTKDICFKLGAEVQDMYPISEVVNHDDSELPEDLTIDMLKHYESTHWTSYWNWYTDVTENRITYEGERLFGKAMELAETESQLRQIHKIYCQIIYLKSFYYRGRLDAGKTTFNQFIQNVIHAHADDFSESEKSELVSSIEQFAYQQVEANYIEYNKKFLDRLVEHGIHELYAGLPLKDLGNADFSKPPVDWIHRYWIYM